MGLSETIATIVAEIEVSQRCELRKHSRQPLCPYMTDVVVAEIEANLKTSCTSSCRTQTLEAEG